MPNDKLKKIVEDTNIEIARAKLKATEDGLLKGYESLSLYMSTKSSSGDVHAKKIAGDADEAKLYVSLLNNVTTSKNELRKLIGSAADVIVLYRKDEPGSDLVANFKRSDALFEAKNVGEAAARTYNIKLVEDDVATGARESNQTGHGNAVGRANAQNIAENHSSGTNHVNPNVVKPVVPPYIILPPKQPNAGTASPVQPPANKSDPFIDGLNRNRERSGLGPVPEHPTDPNAVLNQNRAKSGFGPAPSHGIPPSSLPQLGTGGSLFPPKTGK